MRVIHSQLLGIDQGSVVMFSDFEDDGPMWAGSGERTMRHRVRFDEGFRAPPVVRVWLGMWDTDHRVNARADITAENITAEGFEIVFTTWGDSRLARVRAEWLALGEVDHPDDDAWAAL
ncbi:MAG: H-type lectin domain-containing protein [Rhodobacteraceae bacterium]|nr:H-type lectin domain-containing protein [Paracoccaceae bacterium]